MASGARSGIVRWLGPDYYGNPPVDWVVAAAIALSLVVVFNLALRVVLHHLRHVASRTYNHFDEFAAEVLAGTRRWFPAGVALYLGTTYLALPQPAVRAIEHVMVVVVLLQAALGGHRAIRVWIDQYIDRHREDDAGGATTMRMLGFMLRVALWSMIAMMFLANLGVDITTLVTSLGIGGVAVALALQNILGNVFASISIALDRPFIIGDFIVVGDASGTVEYIGLRTTRIRALSGEQIVFPNNTLLTNRIHNYKRMYERRVLFQFGVTYQTPPDKLRRIPAVLREIVTSQQKTRFDRAHFKEFGASALIFHVVYFVLDVDYNLYMDIQQAINLALHARLAQERIEFAYPTQTVYVQSDSPSDLSRRCS